MINDPPDSGGSTVIKIHLHIVKDWDQDVTLIGRSHSGTRASVCLSSAVQVFQP